MKNKFTTLFRFLTLAIFLCSGSSVFAQPANDKCENATALTLAADQASCVQVAGDTRMTENATMVTGTPSVCSGGWYTDDVWYSVAIGSTVPSGGIVIEMEYGSMADDIPESGMAFYNSCDASEDPIQCFSNEPGRRTLTIAPSCLSADQTYIIRIWSAGDATANAGTFRICAYENDPIPVDNTPVFYSENFDTGLNGWTTTTLSDPVMDIWRWSADGSFEDVFGNFTYRISGPKSACTGSVGFTGAWNQSNWTGNTDSLFMVGGADYEDYTSELISPTLDLSGINTGLSVRFDQLFRRLNANSAALPFASMQFSIDDGATWSDPQPINADMAANDAERDNNVKLPLPGVEGESAVKIKFTWAGDWYIWIIDNVEVVEANRNEIAALRSAIGNNGGTPVSQIYPVSFLIDIGNNGINEAKDVTATAEIFDMTTGSSVYSETIDIPNIPPFNVNDDSDEVFDNIWPTSFTPPAAVNSFRGVYSVAFDSLDQDLSNDTLDFVFTITDSTFRKDLRDPVEGGNLDGILPAEKDWTYGAGYYTPNGTGYQCSSITFAISNSDDAALVNSLISIYLYSWLDVDGDGDAQETERTLLGSNFHALTGNEINEDLDITVVLNNDIDPGDPILLEDGGQYIVAIEMVSPQSTDEVLAIVADNNQNYLNSWFVNDSLTNLGLPGYAPQHGAFFSGETGTNILLEQDFGFSPHIHMNIDLGTSTKNILSTDNKIDIFPNPVNDVLTVDLDFVQSFGKVEVKVTDVSGKTMALNNYTNVWKEKFTYNVADYAAGTYFLHVATEEGNRVVRFVVAK